MWLIILQTTLSAPTVAQIIQGWRWLEREKILPELQGKTTNRNQGRQNHYSKSIKSIIR